MLESLGISDMEEQVYRALLRDPTAAAGDLALVAGVSHTALRRVLSALEMKGLISHSAGRGPGYVALAPDVAVEGLIRRRQTDLEQIRSYLPQLRQEYHHPEDRGDPVEFVEVVSGRHAVTRRFAQLQQSATESILIFDKPPYAASDDADIQPFNQLELQRLEGRIRYRTIYSNEGLKIPGRWKVIKAYIRAGEAARVSPELPMKLAIADSQLAIMPLSVNAPSPNTPFQVESAVVIHHSSLLDALILLFEAFWLQALPLSFSTDSRKDVMPEGADAETGLLLALLTAGLTDEVIAQQLGMSIRTVRRRIRHLMDHLGVVTRFQAGLQAAKRGWL